MLADREHGTQRRTSLDLFRCSVWTHSSFADVAGKILAIFFPIMAFVAMGFDHVVANMFFIPAAIFAHVPGIDWLDALKNWLFAFLGNLVGAAVFVAGAYYYLYGRDAGEAEAAGQAFAGEGESRFNREAGDGAPISGSGATRAGA
jgi:hypothetical protein